MLIATLTTQRSGSKMLGSMFSAGTQVLPLGEIFNPDSVNPAQFDKYVKAIGYNNAMLQGSDILLDNYFAGLRQLKEIIHFDVMFNQFEMTCLSWNPYRKIFILGYLMERKSLIILLNRDSQRTFLSELYLEKGGVPHSFQEADDGKKIIKLAYDQKKFESYKKHLEFLREKITVDATGYEFFYCANYENISKTQEIPDDLKDLMVSCAQANGVIIEKEKIQIEDPKIRKSGVDYLGVINDDDHASV